MTEYEPDDYHWTKRKSLIRRAARAFCETDERHPMTPSPRELSPEEVAAIRGRADAAADNIIEALDGSECDWVNKTSARQTIADVLGTGKDYLQVPDLCASHEALRAERDRWKANHDNQVKLRRALMDRPDLQDRAKSIIAMQDELATITAERDRLATLLREGVRMWSFNVEQQPTHTWHDWADWKAKVHAALAAPPTEKVTP